MEEKWKNEKKWEREEKWKSKASPSIEISDIAMPSRGRGGTKNHSNA